MPAVAVNGKNIYYTVAEAEGKAKATFVLIHGLGSSSCFYATITPELKKQHRCISIDTYGSGQSKLANSQPENSISSISRDAIGVLDSLSILEKVIVVGHSMGGIVASQLAADFPDRVSGVVLLGPVHPQPKVAEVFEQRIATVKKDGLEALANSVPTAATGKKSLPIHHAFIRALIFGTAPDGYISLCNAIATAQPPSYESIKVPVTILCGTDDATAPRAGCETIIEKYGTKKELKSIVELDGVGHWHCVEAEDEVAKQLLIFAGHLK